MVKSKFLAIIIPIIVVIALGSLYAVQINSSDTSQIDSSVIVEFDSSSDNLQPGLDSNNTDTSDSNSTQPKKDFEVTYTRKNIGIKVLDEKDLLRKNVPPNYKFGNFFDNGLKVGITSTILENDQMHSIRFTNQNNGEIVSVKLHLLVLSKKEVTVGLQEDNGSGFPSGSWISQESFVNSIIPPREENYEFNFQSGIPVSKDKVYHIVIKLVPNNFSTTQQEIKENEDLPFSVIHYKGHTSHLPFNPEDPDIYLPDPAINSLEYDGNNWSVLEKWPSFLLTYDDGKVHGQPYTLKAHWAVQQNIAAGQAIIPHSDYKISNFAFLVNKEKTPTDDLHYGIRDKDNNLLNSGLFAKSEDLTKTLEFVEISLEEPIDMNAGQVYRFYIYSSTLKKDGHYNLWGHEFSYDTSLGYGGEIHRLTTSKYHEVWGPWRDADAIFYFTTAP